MADETLQNHHPSLLSLPVVSCRHKAAPGQTPPLKIRSRVPFLAPYPPFVSYVRRGSMMGESIGRIKRGVLGHRSSSFLRFRCPHACRPLSTVSRGRHRVTLGDIRASVPVHGVVGTVPEGGDATTPSLSLASLGPAFDKRQSAKSKYKSDIWPPPLHLPSSFITSLTQLHLCQRWKTAAE